MNAELIYEYTAKRVGAIHRTLDRRLLGTGVFISPQGHMLSCAHLVAAADPNAIYVRIGDQEIKVSSIESYQDVDIALLKCEKPEDDFDYFTLNTKIAQLNREVFVFGYPDKPYYQQGYFRVSSISSKVFLHVAQTNMQVWGLADRDVLIEGMSGGPVVDLQTRELVGIVYGYDKILEKSIYDTEENLIALESRRLDDFFIPVSIIVDNIETIEEIAMVNKNDEHTNLVNKVVNVLGLLGFKSNLVDLENNQKYSIYSQVTIGFVHYNLLTICFSRNEGELTKSILMDLANQIPRYERLIGEQIEKICIAVETEVDEATMASARDYQIEVIHSDALFTSLIDFSDYLEAAQEQWLEDRADIDEKYIDLRARKLKHSEFTPIDSAEDFILHWIRKSPNSKLLVLGKYGSGKTTLSRRLFYKLAINYAKSQNEAPIPIFVRLGKARTSTLKQIIADLMEDEISMPQANFRTFSKLNELGKLIMLFDGFDEMSQATRRSESYLNMRELSQYFEDNSKVIITCRLEYFIEEKDIESLMSVSEFELLYAQEDFDVIVLEDFDGEQITKFIRRACPEQEIKSMLTLMSNMANLTELARRPVLLDMITQTLPSLSQTKKSINAATLYETYVNRWLDRDLIVGRTTFPQAAKLDLMESIAVEMNRQGSLSLRYEDILLLIKGYFNNDFSKASFHVHDILTNSFLTRNDRDRFYEFSHKSFLEFFLAKRFMGEIREFVKSRKNLHCSFGDRRLPYEILRFMMDMGISQAELWKVIDRTRHRDPDENPFLGGNAVTLLRLFGADFRHRDFANTVLAGALFTNCDLSNSVFRNAYLYDVSFANTITDDVDMTGANATRADFKSARVIYSLDYSPISNCIATDNSMNRLISLWFLSTDDKNLFQKKASLKGHVDDVFCVSFSPNGQLVASGGQDQSIRLWDMYKLEELSVLRGHLGDIRSILFVDANTLLSCGMDGQIIKWDLGRMDMTQSISSEEEYWGMSINTEKQMIVTGDLKGVVKLWKLDELTPLENFSARHGHMRRHIVKFFPGENIILSTCENNSLFIWNFEDDSWREVHKQDAPIKALAIRDDGLVASGAEDGTIALWKGKDLHHQTTIEAHVDYVSAIEFDSNKNRMFSTGPDGTVAIWNLENYQLMDRFEEVFPNDISSCKGLNITNVVGLSKARLAHLKRQGAIDNVEND